MDQPGDGDDIDLRMLDAWLSVVREEPGPYARWKWMDDFIDVEPGPQDDGTPVDAHGDLG